MDYNDAAAHRGRSRSTSRAPRDESGVRDPETRTKLKKMQKKMQARSMNRQGKAGEADRHIHEKKPKHLFSGKRKMGKTDRR
jgi:nucleolar GTP-binding protein